MLNKWDIILVDFPFREDPSQTKQRPCVIIDVDNESVEFVIVGITSTPARRETDYAIKYCRQAHIKEGSVVMTDHIVKVSASVNFRHIGHLDKTDRLNVMRLMDR